MCYPGQNFDMSVPVPEGTALDEPGLLDLAERFHDQHEAERGFCFRSQQPLVRGVRVTARGFTPKPDHFAETGTVSDAAQAREGHPPRVLGRGWVDTPGLRRHAARRGRTRRRSRADRGAVHRRRAPARHHRRARRPRQLRRSNWADQAARRYRRMASGAKTAMMPMLQQIEAKTLPVSE